MEVMKIAQYLKDAFSWMKSKIQTAWSRSREEGPEVRHTATANVAGFFTGPLSETEYALLKRVSGIRDRGHGGGGLPYLAAGLSTALVVLGLCLILSIGLYKVSGPGPCLLQEPSSGPMTA